MKRITQSALLLSLSAALIGGPLAVATPDTTTPGVTAQAASGDIVNASEARKDAWRQEILSQINSYRASKGLYPLKYSRTISGIAQDESNRAVRDENYNHSMNFLSDRRAGTWNDAGEITALSYRISTADLVNFWKTSPNHNKVLLSKTIDVVGIGVTEVDGMLAKKKEPWRLVGVVDGFSYTSNNAPGDTSTRVTGATTAAASYSVKGGIATKYHQLGGAGALGAPIMNERALAGSAAYQVFSKSGKNTKIMWKNGIGAYAIKEYGAIGQKWKAAGQERGYGFPSTDERTLSDGAVYQSFKNGTTVTKIMWKNGVGSGAVKETGAIGQKWKAAGFERGYGYPITDEIRKSDGTVYQQFKKGTRTTTIYWKNGVGTWVR